jgi:hypothetical protein
MGMKAMNRDTELNKGSNYPKQRYPQMSVDVMKKADASHKEHKMNAPPGANPKEGISWENQKFMDKS